MSCGACVVRRQRCHIRTAFQLSCRRRGAPMAPCSTPGEAQTFQISRRQRFSHPRRRARAGKAPDPEGRTRQGKQPQTAGNAGQPAEDRGPVRRWPGRYSRTPVQVRQGRSASRSRTGARSAGRVHLEVAVSGCCLAAGIGRCAARPGRRGREAELPAGRRLPGGNGHPRAGPGGWAVALPARPALRGA